ncbi:MAG: hypothetical protein ACRENZ_07765 [Thermodesulfobacteriota bacterium]
MNRTGIKIDRLNLRLRGVSSVVARDLISGLGVELMRRLSDQRDVLKGKRGVKLDNLDTGKLKVNGDKNPTGLRSMTAERIAGAIISKTKT